MTPPRTEPSDPGTTEPGPAAAPDRSRRVVPPGAGGGGCLRGPSLAACQTFMKNQPFVLTPPARVAIKTLVIYSMRQHRQAIEIVSEKTAIGGQQRIGLADSVGTDKEIGSCAFAWAFVTGVAA